MVVGTGETGICRRASRIHRREGWPLLIACKIVGALPAMYRMRIALVCSVRKSILPAVKYRHMISYHSSQHVKTKSGRVTRRCRYHMQQPVHW